MTIGTFWHITAEYFLHRSRCRRNGTCYGPYMTILALEHYIKINIPYKQPQAFSLQMFDLIGQICMRLLF